MSELAVYLGFLVFMGLVLAIDLILRLGSKRIKKKQAQALRYRINLNPGKKGQNEIHNSNCYWYYKLTNYAYLDTFTSSTEALKYTISKNYNSADKCELCCKQR